MCLRIYFVFGCGRAVIVGFNLWNPPCEAKKPNFVFAKEGKKNRKRACIIPNIFISKGWEICASTERRGGGLLFPKGPWLFPSAKKSVLTVYTQPIDPQITAEGMEDEKVRNIFFTF